MLATELEGWDSKSEAGKNIERERVTKSLIAKLSLFKTSRTVPILVGHNLGWDIAFLTETFLHPLPHTPGEFVRAADDMFPRLLDTKTLAANHTAKFKDLDLSSIHSAPSAASQLPRCCWEPGMGNRVVSAHDAGHGSASDLPVAKLDCCKN